MKKIIRSLILVSLISSAFAFDSFAAMNLGLSKEDGGQAGNIFDFAASARSLAMGHAHTAVANDASATYWNPAGLSQLERKDVVTMYSSLQENTGFGFASFAQPTVDYGTLGYSLISLRSSGFEKRDDTGGQVLGSFNQSETGLIISDGFQLRNRLSLGASVKAIREEIDAFSATGYGLDFGMMMNPWQKINMGLVFRNVVAPSLKLKSVADKYPRAARFGVNYTPSKKWMIAADLDKTDNRSLKINLGSEWKVNETLALRAGLSEAEITAGLGIKIGVCDLDYAFGFGDSVNGTKGFGGSHRIGLHFAFGPNVSDQSVSQRWQKKGQVVLDLLAQEVAADEKAYPYNADKLVTMGQDVIKHQGYNKPQDLYVAQGYIYFLKKEYDHSMQSLSEAVALDPMNETLKINLEKSRARMTEENAKQVITVEFKLAKDLFEKGDFHGVVKSCTKILSLKPDHIEAQAYLDDAKKRIEEPILREMRIAKAKYDQQEYLDAIKHLQIVKGLDAANQDATNLMDQSIAALEKNASIQVEALTLKPADGVYEISRNSKKSRDLYSQGLILYSQGKLNDAVVAWQEAVKFDGDNTLARNAFNRALTELHENQHQ